MSDRDVDRLLSGKPPGGDDDLAELAGFVRDVKDVYGQAPAEATAQRHLAAMVDATRLLSEERERAQAPASEAGGHRPAPERPNWRKRVVFNQLLTRMWAKIALASAAAVLATGGLAVAGALPDPAQSAVASAAGQVGVSLEDPDEPDGDNNNVDDGAVNNVDDGDVSDGDGRSDTPGEGQSGDSGDQSDQGQSGDSGDSGDSGEGQSGDSGEGQSGDSGEGQSGDSGGSGEQSGGPGTSGDSGQSGGSGGSGESGN